MFGYPNMHVRIQKISFTRWAIATAAAAPRAAAAAAAAAPRATTTAAAIVTAAAAAAATTAAAPGATTTTAATIAIAGIPAGALDTTIAAGLTNAAVMIRREALNDKTK